jgi:G protein-coupled receptor 107
VHIYTTEGAEPVDRTQMGFLISFAKADAELEDELAKGTCILDSQYVKKLFTMQDIADQTTEEGQDFVYSNTIAKDMAGQYSLYFVNCVEHSAVSFDITVELYNHMEGGKKDYLSAGEKPLPTLYFLCFCAFVAMGCAWAWNLHTSRNTQPGSVQKIHLLMLLLVMMKALTVLCQALMFHSRRVKGDADGWNIAYYFFTSVRGLMLFTVVVLIGTGWSFLKPFLNEREKNVLMIVIPMQVFANIATIVLDDNGVALAGWLEWRDLFHLLDIACCCAILFPIVWSIKHLREAALTDGKKVRNMNKLILFRQFYVMVVAYIYFTRIIVYLLKQTMAYNMTWLADLASEAATMCFYCVTGYMFRPIPDNPYLHLNEDELDEESIEMYVEEGRSV